MKRIKIRGKNGQGLFALVDNDDYERFKHIKWYLHNGYAKNRDNIKGKRKTLSLHRLINKTPENLFVDHINRNRLDNRKCNLKNVSWAVNRLNISVHKDNLHKTKNIDFHNRKWTIKKWRVRIQRFGKLVFFGMYLTLNEAIIARDNYYAKSIK